MTAPQGRPGGLDGNARGLAVLVVALVIGFALLLKAGGGGGGETASSGAEPPVTTAPLDATTTVPETTTSAPASDRAPSDVQVIVLNGSGQTGAAGEASDTIGQSGYTMLTPGNATNIEATTIYYDTDYEVEATDIALVLGKSSDAVQPLTDASLGGAEGDANVVVVLGADTPPVN